MRFSPFLVTFVARQFGAWAVIAVAAVVGRTFGPAARGAIEGLVVLRLGMHAVAAGGVPAAATYLVAQGRAPLAAVAGPVTLASLWLGCVAALAVAAAAFLAPSAFRPIPPVWVALFAAAAPATLVAQALSGVLLGAGRTNAWNGLAVASRATLLGSLVLVAWEPLRVPETVVAGMIAAEIVMAALAAVAVGPGWRPRRDTGPLREARRYTRSAFLHGALVFAFLRADILVLDAVAGTVEGGLYAAAALGREMLLFIPWIAGLLHFARTAAARARPGARATPAMGPVSISVTLATAAVLMSSPTWFVTGIHGSEFASAAPLVLILVPAGLVGGAGHVLLQELLGRGAPRATWIAPAAALVVSWTGNAVFVPRHGATGAAWVALAAATTLAAVAAAGVSAARRLDRKAASR